MPQGISNVFVKFGVCISNNSIEITTEGNCVLLKRKIYSIKNQIIAFHHFTTILFCIYSLPFLMQGYLWALGGLRKRDGVWRKGIRGHTWTTTLIKLTGCESLPEEILAASFAFSGCHGWVWVSRSLQLQPHFILLSSLGQIFRFQGIILCLVGFRQQLCQEVLGQFLYRVEGRER